MASASLDIANHSRRAASAAVRTEAVEKTAGRLAPTGAVLGKPSLAGLTRHELKEKLAAIGVPERELRMRVGQLWHWLYLRGLRDFADAFSRDVNRDQIVDILARNTVVQDRALYATIVPHQVDRNGQVNREGLAADLDWYAAHGYLTGDKPDLNTVVDMRFVDYALGQLGRQ